MEWGWAMTFFGRDLWWKLDKFVGDLSDHNCLAPFWGDKKRIIEVGSYGCSDH